MANIVIGIPVYISNKLHLEFTKKTVDSILTSHKHEVILIKNYCKDEFKKELEGVGLVVPNPRGNNVASAWNLALEMGIYRKKVDYILVSNNDLVFHPLCINNLVKFAEEHPEFIMWTASEHNDLRTLQQAVPRKSFDEHPHFSCFMVKPSFVEKLKEKDGEKEPLPGFFDENFGPAYFEDGDMHNRILRAGYKAAKTASALFYHFGSRTIKTDSELNRKNAKSYEENRIYFQRKWGWDPHNRVTPNDDPIRFKYKEPFTP